MSAALQLTGFTELTTAMGSLRESVRTRIAKRALVAGSVPVLKSAKQRVAVRSKTLKRSLGRKSAKSQKSGSAYVLLGPRVGFRAQVGVVKRGPKTGQPIFEDPAKIAHLVEFGHGGKHPAPAHPFLRPALAENKDAAIEIIGQKAWEGISAEAEKLAAKH